jgi:hypothetical protein
VAASRAMVAAAGWAVDARLMAVAGLLLTTSREQ